MVIRIFLLILLGFSTVKAQEVSQNLIWEDGKATQVEIIFPDGFKVNVNSLTVNIIDAKNPIFGRKEAKNNRIVFRPIIPFTHGLTYEVRISNKPISSFEVISDSKHPLVKNIFPQLDTLPENLLKLYIVFDQSMGEGRAQDNIRLYNNGQEIKEAFLALQPELWNKTNDVLTIWIDPGRVKRDLKRNQQLGEVLKKSNSYRLVIENKMISNEGKELSNAFEKTFYVTGRDEVKPEVASWSVNQPLLGSMSELTITFNEPLDYQVVMNAIKVKRGHVEIEGTFAMVNDYQISFIPKTSWVKGDYQLEVESRIEDLAGNNLNRLFDRDLTKKARYEPKEYYYLDFKVKE